MAARAAIAQALLAGDRRHSSTVKPPAVASVIPTANGGNSCSLPTTRTRFSCANAEQLSAIPAHSSQAAQREGLTRLVRAISRWTTWAQWCMSLMTSLRGPARSGHYGLASQNRKKVETGRIWPTLDPSMHSCSSRLQRRKGAAVQGAQRRGHCERMSPPRAVLLPGNAQHRRQMARLQPSRQLTHPP